ncbi:MAG: hypothetical protein FWG16_02185 [Micrococcales bacterium]|nr:hypothetical protein [Micrococcales bacterium]
MRLRATFRLSLVFGLGVGIAGLLQGCGVDDAAAPVASKEAVNLNTGLHGVVVDDLGDVVEGARVRAFLLKPFTPIDDPLYVPHSPGTSGWVDYTSISDEPWVITDSAGLFELSNLALGWYAVEVEALGLMPFYLPDVLPLDEAGLFEITTSGWANVGFVDATVGNEWNIVPTYGTTRWDDLVDGFSYQYEASPENNPELWRSFDSFAQMNAVSQIDPNVLPSLSTAELLEAVLSYNFFSNYQAYDSPQQGMDVVIAGFNGLQELLARPDVGRVLLDFYSEVGLNQVVASDAYGVSRFEFLELLLAQNQVMSNLAVTGRAELTDAVQKKVDAKLDLAEHGFSLYEDTLITARVIGMDYPDLFVDLPGVKEALDAGRIDDMIVVPLTSALAEYAARESRAIPPWGIEGCIPLSINYYYTTIYTPIGSPVEAKVWCPFVTSTEQNLLYSNTLWKTRYPNAVLYSSPAGFNCHSYAFHSLAISNPYSFDDPSPYWTDGSYTWIATAAMSAPIPEVAAHPGVRGEYAWTNLLGDHFDHSVYVVSKDLVRSKWGQSVMMQHSVDYDPYQPKGYSNDPTRTDYYVKSY